MQVYWVRQCLLLEFFSHVLLLNYFYDRQLVGMFFTGIDILTEYRI